ncbi:MAG TPA: hypothetical protein VKU36_04835 [Candidatus Babeliales bacterium]|nr:hypothetical protein [Candidatus Babeliales bacterium]
MEMLQYFLTCYFHFNAGFDDLDNLIQDFKKEVDSEQLKFIRELHGIIQTNSYALADSILKKYGHRTLDNLEEVKKFINFLYDRLIDRPTDVKAEDFQKNYKVVFCPECTPDPEAVTVFGLIEKAMIIDKDLQIYICKPCKLVWLTEDIRADNAQDYKKFMKTLGLKGIWKELKDVDYL